MQLNEIIDPNSPEHKARLKAAMNQINKQGGPSSVPHIEKEARNQRNAEYEARRERVHQALQAIAQKYKGDQFDEFEKEAESTIDPQELSLVDLPWAFNAFNPEKKEENHQHWEDYGKNYDKVEKGLGPGGLRNYTGD